MDLVQLCIAKQTQLAGNALKLLPTRYPQLTAAKMRHVTRRLWSGLVRQSSWLVSDTPLNYIFRGHDNSGFFASALILGNKSHLLRLSPHNVRPKTTPYLCIIPVLDEWRMQKLRADRQRVWHYSTVIDDKIHQDLRSGRALLVFDHCNEGPQFDPDTFQELLTYLDANAIPPRRVIWLTQNRALKTAYMNWGRVNPIGPRSCYDEGKRCAETLFFDYWRQHKLRIKVARIFNTYGPRMHPNDGRVVSNFVVQALLGHDITVFGDGSQTRSFCYVDDLIDGLVRLMNTPDKVTGPINLGNPGEFTMLQLAGMVIDLTGSRSRIVHRPLPQDDPRQRSPDISQANGVLGWRPQLQDGLMKTIAYFDDLLSDESIKPLIVHQTAMGQSTAA